MVTPNRGPFFPRNFSLNSGLLPRSSISKQRKHSIFVFERFQHMGEREDKVIYLE